MPRRTLFVVMIAAMLLLVGCPNGSDDGGDTTTTTDDGTTTTTEDTTTTTGDGGGGDADFDLLMAATFGEPDKGSYVRYRDADVMDWRFRHEFVGGDYDTPPPGYGACMVASAVSEEARPRGVEPNEDERMSLFDFRRVYLFVPDEEGQLLPLGPAPEFRVGSRPIDVIDERPDGSTLDPFVLEYDGQPDRGQFAERVNELLRGAGEVHGPSVVLALDFTLNPAMGYGSGADDPTPVDEEVTEEVMSAAVASNQAKGKIWIADYGLPEGDTSTSRPGNIGGDVGQPRPGSNEPVTTQYGHGLMVASVAAQVAPNSEVTVVDVTEDVPNGRQVISVASIDAALNNAGVIRFDGPSVLNLSLGFYDCDALEGVEYEGSLAAALDAVLEPYIVSPKVTVVAAAGNDYTSQPFYPAALDGVQGVGAGDVTVLNTEACLVDGLEAWSPADQASGDCADHAGQAAPFTNFGANARLDPAGSPEDQVFYAGVDMIVHYPVLDPPIDYEYFNYQGVVPLDTGRVRVSGTSLAAPFYAACLQEDGSLGC